MRVRIDTRVPVTVSCECGNTAPVADLEAAVVWAFHEGLLHGHGCHLEILVELTLLVEVATKIDPNQGKLGIP